MVILFARKMFTNCYHTRCNSMFRFQPLVSKRFIERSRLLCKPIFPVFYRKKNCSDLKVRGDFGSSVRVTNDVFKYIFKIRSPLKREYFVRQRKYHRSNIRRETFVVLRPTRFGSFTHFNGPRR